jgi:replicative DNA helicase
MSKLFGLEVQRLFLEMILHDPTCFVRVQNIFNVNNFDRTLRPSAEFIFDHCEKHSTMPLLSQINAVCEQTFEPVEGMSDEHVDWFLDEFESFTKQKELTRAIREAMDLLDKGEYDPVETLIKNAVQIGLTKDLGLNYFDDPIARLNMLRSTNGLGSTGWLSVDQILLGGVNRGELNIIIAGSGGGKSLFMQNQAVNWVLSGLNGVYITLELSNELCAKRVDSMMTNIAGKEIFKNINDVELKVKMLQKKSGEFYFKYMNAQSKVGDIRTYIRELQIKTGIKVDFVVVDYLDLVMPSGVKINPTDLFTKDKYVSEELRNLAKDLNVFFITACQINRGGVDEVEYNHSHISGGISKIMTADNVFAGYMTNSMREAGRFQLQFLKTRNSNGVGKKVELHFDTETLKLRDLTEDEQEQKRPSFMDSLKPAVTVTNNENQISRNASFNKPEANSSKLKEMLAQIKAANK